MAVAADMAMTIADTGETQGIANTDTTATGTLSQELIVDYYKDPCVSSQQHLSSLGPGLEASQDCVPTPAMVTEPPLSLRENRVEGWEALPAGSWEIAPLDSSPSLLHPLQVPAMVKSIHQILMSHVTVDTRLRTDIVRLAGEHPADVVLTLLHCAPTCDRYGAQCLESSGLSSL